MRTLQRLFACVWLLGYPTLPAAEMPNPERFEELLNAARGHVGQAALVDAEETRIRDRDALNFLFRTENGVLLSISLDVDTTAVLATSTPKSSGPKKPVNFLDRVAAFLGGAPSPSDQSDDGKEPEITTAPAESTDPSPSEPNPGRSNDPGRDRGRDKGGDSGGGPGNGNGRK